MNKMMTSLYEQELNRLLRESQRTQNLFVRYQNTGLRSDEGSDDGKRKFVARVPKVIIAQ